MIGIADNCTPVKFITLQADFASEATYTVAEHFRGMITSIAGAILSGTFGRIEVFVNDVYLFGQQSASPDYLTPLTQFGSINVPVDTGDVIKVVLTPDTAGPLGCIVAGYLFDAYST